MALALDTLKRAGAKANNRAAVVKALFATKNRKSAIGTYSIDKNGDTSLTDYGVYKIKARPAGVPEEGRRQRSSDAPQGGGPSDAAAPHLQHCRLRTAWKPPPPTGLPFNVAAAT